MSEPATPPLGLFIQPACLQHKYIRHSNSSHIFERPERLRAVLLGVAAAIARLEEAEATLSNVSSGQTSTPNPVTPLTSDDLSSLLSGLSIGSAVSASFAAPKHLSIVPQPVPPRIPGQILQHHPAIQLAHSPPPDEALHQASLTASSGYLKNLVKWCNEALDRIKETGSEIPGGLGLNQGDLYLGPGSILAIEGAIQTVCQAIDRVCALPVKLPEPATPPAFGQTTPPGSTGPGYFGGGPQESRQFSKAFCAIRPPGHHCGEDEPSGFCYVNNVVVGALHAYLEHDIDRAIIIDFDLHHGNGTQALVMPLNAASYAEELAIKAGKPSPAVYGKRGKKRRNWQSFYGSVHDIYSYPCEDGDIDLIKDASISLAAHGQYIENIHLQPYSSEEDFYERIYPKYLTLLQKAKAFMQETNAEPDRTIVLISAGFDACEHEYQAMQRHDRRVPVSFFSRYTRDIVAFADEHTEGKIVSVLEGGYSDRALTSAAMGHALGLLDKPGRPEWWTDNELINIEKATKKRRNGKIAPFPSDLSSYPHLSRTHALLAHFEGTPPEAIVPSVTSTPQHGSRMTLRDRKKAVGSNVEEDMAVTPPARRAGRGRGVTPRTTPAKAKAEREVFVAPVAELPQMPPAEADRPIESQDVKREVDHPAEVDLVRSMETLGAGSIDGKKTPATAHASSAAAWAQPAETLGNDSVIGHQSHTSLSGPERPVQQPPTSTSPAHADLVRRVEEQKIFLRFARPTTSSAASNADGIPNTTNLYPAIPTIGVPAGADATNYREFKEGSAGLSGESEGEYVSARSELSEHHVADESRDRAKVEERESSVGSLASGGVPMPGRFNA